MDNVLLNCAWCLEQDLMRMFEEQTFEDDIPLSDLFTEESLASTSTTDFSDAKQNTGRQNNVSDTQFNDESKVPLTVTVKDKSADLCKSCNQHNIHAMSVKRLPCNGSITNQLEVGDFSPDSCRKCSIATSDGTLLPINSAQNAQYTFAQAGDEKCVKQLSMCSRNNTDTTTSTTSVSDQRDSNADAENSDDPRRSGRDVERSRKKMKRSDKANTFSIPSSTYESVRLLSRVWRRPEGGVNRSFLKNLLDTVTFHAMSRPGITAERLAESFGHLLSPVHVRELLEILDSLGCVKLLRVSQKKKISLFSTPPTTAHIEVADGVDTIGASMQELVVEPAVDCTHRLGAFLSYLH